MDTTPSKKCTNCCIDKPFTDFSILNNFKKGTSRLRAECKKCRIVKETKRNQDNKEAHNRYSSKWKLTHADKVREYEKNRHREKRVNDLQFKEKTNIITNTRHFVTGRKKSYTDIACTRLQIKEWFEYQFDKGFVWDSNNEWQIDHVIPLSMFDLTNPQEKQQACHWSNLRPVSEQVNRQKNNKIMKSVILNHANKIKQFLKSHSDYQTSMETCWWQRVELWYGKNEQDDEDFDSFLKWAIRSQAPNLLINQEYGEGSTTRR